MNIHITSLTLSAIIAVSAAFPPTAVAQTDTKTNHNIDWILNIEQEQRTATRSTFGDQAIETENKSEQISKEGIVFPLGEGQGEAQLSAGIALSEAIESNKGGDNWVANSDIIYRDTEDGAAAYALIPKEESSTEWELQLPPGVEAKVTPSGEVTFQTALQTGGNITYAAYLEEPWAVDQNGEKVPTWYEIDSGKIVQKIDRSSSSEEVLADPRISYGKGAYLNAWGDELRALQGMATIGVNGAFLSGYMLSKLPTKVRLVLGGVCAVAGPNVLDIVEAIKAIPQYDPHTCYQLKIVPYVGGTRPHPVGEHECGK